MTKALKVLFLLLIILPNSAGAAFKARVLRSQKPEDRISGLTVVKDEIEVVLESGQAPQYSANLLLDFEAKNRTLVADEVFFSIDRKVIGKQRLSIKVPLNKKLVPLWFMSTGAMAKPQQERIIISFPDWKEPEISPVPIPTNVKKETIQQTEKETLAKMKAGQATVGQAIATEEKAPERHRRFVERLSFEIAPLWAVQQMGRNAGSVELSWNPKYKLSPNLYLRGNLGGTVFKGIFVSSFFILDFTVSVGYLLSPSIFAELGGGGQSWFSNGGTRPQASSKVGWHFPANFLKGFLFRPHRVFTGYSVVAFPSLVHEMKLGIGFVF